MTAYTVFCTPTAPPYSDAAVGASLMLRNTDAADCETCKPWVLEWGPAVSGHLVDKLTLQPAIVGPVSNLTDTFT